MRHLVCGLTVMIAGTISTNAETVVVGSKNFEESRLLAEIFARLIEDRTDLEVERRFNLAGTQVCFEALRTGAVDLYPEYTGTGLASILGETPGGDSAEVLGRVRQEFLARWDLWWLSPLGFENAYALAVPRELAEREGVRTLSDLVPLAGSLRAGVGYEFFERPDGLPGLERHGLSFAEVRTLQQTLKYQAVSEGRIDCLDVYTTDGRLLVHDLVVLDDDRGFFPPYEATALVRQATLQRHPEVARALVLLSGVFGEEDMRQLNRRVENASEPVAVVCRDALAQRRILGAVAPDPDVVR
ncbi:MAG: glycine betaine ABC transporter substrate-binding protein, partial [Acidobacteriota bacterium]|nr:glycine betaine ABC transporter substrate-binding protein [Acidobacteriota bacterium]